jgi:hypothetical protein
MSGNRVDGDVRDLRSGVLLGPMPGRCGSSRQLARTARCEEYAPFGSAGFRSR